MADDPVALGEDEEGEEEEEEQIDVEALAPELYAAVKQSNLDKVLELLALGVLLYAGTGIYSLFRGYAYLDYTALSPHHPEHGQHLGILIVEAGVGITVTGVMVAIYYAFAARTPILNDEEW